MNMETSKIFINYTVRDGKIDRNLGAEIFCINKDNFRKNCLELEKTFIIGCTINVV